MFRSGFPWKLLFACVLRSIIWIRGCPLRNRRALRWLFPGGALLRAFREIFRAGVVGNNALPCYRCGVKMSSDERLACLRCVH